MGGGTRRRLPPVLEFTETLQSNRERGIYVGIVENFYIKVWRTKKIKAGYLWFQIIWHITNWMKKMTVLYFESLINDVTLVILLWGLLNSISQITDLRYGIQQLFPYLFIVECFAYFESNCMPWWYLLQHLASLEAVSVRNPLIIASPAPFGSLWTGHLSFCTNYCRNCYGHPISILYMYILYIPFLW